ncbi:MAG: isopeptide-forming domain-containing fimbrial protein, partial [Microbacterium sp.]|nr:isopeptide-forming domain-containing fimbrial protein [Microbacterium sp.]
MGLFAVRRTQETHGDTPVSRGARWRRGVRKALSGVTGAALVASSLAVVATTVTAAPAFAAAPFICEPGAIYAQSTTEIREFSVTPTGGTLGTTSLGTGHSNNALGISSGGRYAYTITNAAAAGNKTLAVYDRVADTTTTHVYSMNVGSIVRGAVHPKSGVYYFATGTQADSTIQLYAWDPATPAAAPVQVGKLAAAAGSAVFGSTANGDMAFSASGQLVLVAEQYVYAADIPATVTPSTATISAKQVHDMGAGVAGNGIAFGNLGHIFVSVANGGSRIIEIDLARGTTVNTTPIGISPTDLASCTFPNTLTLKKDVQGGRFAPTDQFGLRIVSPAGYQVPQTDAVTKLNATGLQPDYAGPIFTNQGDTFTLSENAQGSTDLRRYASALSCTQQNPDGTTTPVAVNAAGQVTQPAGPLGTDVICTIVNTLLTPKLELSKTADPVSGTPVVTGQRISYTVEARNTGNTRLDPATVSDDLSAVLAHATVDGAVKTKIDGIDVPTGGAAITGTTLAWTGALDPAQKVTITYSVIVDDDAEGQSIANRVTASGTPPSPFDPVVPPAVTVTNPVAGFEIAKTADPASGTAVEPGQTITYTLTGRNTGATVLDPVALADDLSGALAHGTY